MDFRDLPKTKTGALLVGFEFGLSPLEDSDTLAICSVQGIFSGGGRTHKPLFRKHGGEPQSITSILADEGYAVGGLELAPGDRVTGVRVHFCAITKDGLSRDTSYDSDWIGPAGDEPAVKLGDGRRPVVGIAGASSTLVNRLGLILATSGSESPTPEKPRAKKSLSDGPTAEPTTKTAMTPQAMLATGTMPPSGAMPTTTDSARRVLANLPGGSDQPLAPVPDPEAIRAAKLKIRDSFKDSESGASSSKPMNKKWELARRLYEASKTEDDQVVRYALLDEARKLTVQTGDLKAVLMTIDDLASRFQIDEVPLTIESLTEASKVTTANSEKATTGADKREVAQKALRLIAKAVEHEQFADADKLVELARKLATGDSLLRQQITWRSDRLAEQRKAYEDAQPELETLKNDPSDAAANLVAGRYRCLFQEDWKAGLPLLAKGSDDTLKRLAEQELNPPGEPDAQVKLGDEWLSAAGSNKPSAPYFKMRARQWYETAWPRLTGVVSKQSTQMKLEEMLGGHGLRAEFFSGVDKFDNPIKSRVDPQIDFKWNQSPMDDLPPQFTVRWTGLLVPPGKGGQFTIVLERDTDAGARLWLDSKLLIDEGSGPRGEYKSYKLAAKSPRRLKLVYFSAGKGKNAHISLRWSQKEEFPEQPIPAESLFQEHSDAEKVYSQLPVPKPGNNAALIITSSEPVPTIPLPTRTP